MARDAFRQLLAARELQGFVAHDYGDGCAVFVRVDGGGDDPVTGIVQYAVALAPASSAAPPPGDCLERPLELRCALWLQGQVTTFGAFSALSNA